MLIELSGGILDGQLFGPITDTIQVYQKPWIGHGLLIYLRISRTNNGRVVFEFDRVDKNG